MPAAWRGTVKADVYEGLDAAPVFPVPLGLLGSTGILDLGVKLPSGPFGPIHTQALVGTALVDVVSFSVK